MKAIWKGTIGFGLVNIPVKLYSATRSSSLDLDMVDRRDHSHIQYRRVNASTGREVKWDDIAKAYLINDEYVLLDEDDFIQAAPEKSKIIEVNHFVNEEEIDTVYYENSYYAVPEASGVKAYALLREALKKSGKVGIARFVLRTAETLTVLKPMDDVLVLSKIRFAEEVRDTAELDLPKRAAVKPAELKMALSLIEQYTQPFDIRKFKDEYSAELLKLIKAKASGKKPRARKLKMVHTQSDDLMEQLKASLAKRKTS